MGRRSIASVYLVVGLVGYRPMFCFIFMSLGTYCYGFRRRVGRFSISPSAMLLCGVRERLGVARYSR